MRIGAHVPTRGRLLTSITAARERAAEAVQIFASNPRGWAPPAHSRLELDGFRQAWEASGIGPLFVHAPYVVNVASPDPEFRRRSERLVRRSIEACELAGAVGFVVHAGAGGRSEPAEALARAARLLRAALSEVDSTAVMVELTAGAAGSVAATWPEAARLFDAVSDERLLLCADTCHLFAAGYALDDPRGVTACFEELRHVALADRLAVVHANDAGFPRGSRRDRHERIAQGHIGRVGFRAILARPELADAAVIVETPGGAADHRRDVELLRRLAP